MLHHRRCLSWRHSWLSMLGDPGNNRVQEAQAVWIAACARAEPNSSLSEMTPRSSAVRMLAGCVQVVSLAVLRAGATTEPVSCSDTPRSARHCASCAPATASAAATGGCRRASSVTANIRAWRQGLGGVNICQHRT